MNFINEFSLGNQYSFSDNYNSFQTYYQSIQVIIDDLTFNDMPMDPQPKYIKELLSNQDYTKNVQQLENTIEKLYNETLQLRNTIDSILSLKNTSTLTYSINNYYNELNSMDKTYYFNDLIKWVKNIESSLSTLFIVCNSILTVFGFIMLLSIILSYGKLTNKCVIFILVLLIVIALFNFPLFIGASLFSSFRELVTQFNCAGKIFIKDVYKNVNYICNNPASVSSDIDDLQRVLAKIRNQLESKKSTILTESVKNKITSFTENILTHVSPYRDSSNIQNTDHTDYNDIYYLKYNGYCSYSSHYYDMECISARKYLNSVNSFCNTVSNIESQSFLFTLELMFIYYSQLNDIFYSYVNSYYEWDKDISFFNCRQNSSSDGYYYNDYDYYRYYERYYYYFDSDCKNYGYYNEHTVIMLSFYYYFFSITCFILIYHRQKSSTCCGCCLCCSCCKFCNCCGCCGCCIFEEQNNEPKGELEDVHLKNEPENIVIPKDKETNLPSPTGENQNEEEEIINNIPSEPNVLQEEEENQEIFKELFPTDGGEYLKISKIDPHIHINKLHSNKITSFILLTNGKFVSGCSEGSMCLTSINYDSKTWNKEISLPKAHNQAITSLCESGTNKLVSSSLDHTIKIWDIETKTFDLITTLTDHTDSVYKVIILSSNNNIMSCSGDKTIRLWNNLAYHQLATFKEDNPVYYISELKHHGNIIIANCGNDQFEYYLSFWNTDTNTSDKIAFNAKTNAMIELSPNLIAVAAMNPNCIVFIINPILFQIVKQVEIKNLTGNACGMCKYDDGSLLCGTEGRLSQIMLCENMKIGYINEKKEKKFDGQNGIIVVENGEYIVGCDNNSKGLYVFKIENKKTV